MLFETSKLVKANLEVFIWNMMQRNFYVWLKIVIDIVCELDYNIRYRLETTVKSIVINNELPRERRLVKVLNSLLMKMSLELVASYR